MKHKFVTDMPSNKSLEKNIIYISIEHDITKHLCPCGCGEIIVATLDPERYTCTYDGETVSLHPSFGNWQHDCKSHYFIKNNQIIWAGNFNESQIKSVINSDTNSINKYKENKTFLKTIINKITKFFK